MKIFMTGERGFVGINMISYLKDKYELTFYNKDDSTNQTSDIILHFAGKAHDNGLSSSSLDYYESNTILTKNIFDSFLNSDAKIFITLSSVKAVTDSINGVLTEEFIPDPVTDYGKSKLLAEEYILSKKLPNDKKVYILRPCMIHGPGNKGNLNTLYKFISKGFPWPLGKFDNQRSFCSIENLCFVISEFIERNDIPSGIYNIADNDSISTNDLIRMIAESQNKILFILNIPKTIIILFSKFGTLFNLSFNSNKLKKLTETYLVSNIKLRNVLGKDLPVSSKVGFIKTFNSFKD